MDKLPTAIPPLDFGIGPERPHEEPRGLTLALEAIRTAGLVMSVGAVWWASRAAGLVSSLLAITPTWRHIDPLPVLGRDRRRSRRRLGRSGRRRGGEGRGLGVRDVRRRSKEAAAPPSPRVRGRRDNGHAGALPTFRRAPRRRPRQAASRTVNPSRPGTRCPDSSSAAAIGARSAADIPAKVARHRPPSTPRRCPMRIPPDAKPAATDFAVLAGSRSCSLNFRGVARRQPTGISVKRTREDGANGVEHQAPEKSVGGRSAAPRDFAQTPTARAADPFVAGRPGAVASRQALRPQDPGEAGGVRAAAGAHEAEVASLRPQSRPAGARAAAADVRGPQPRSPATPLFASPALAGAEFRNIADTGSPTVVTSAAVAPIQRTNELVFVDTATPDYQKLVDSMRESALAEGRNLEFVLIEQERDGIRKITDTLAQKSDLDAIHIVSHAEDGSVQLGQGEARLRDAGEARGRDQELGRGAHRRAATSCSTAAISPQPPRASRCVDAMSRLTGADVAASEDADRRGRQGGDWELEFKTGSIEARVAVGTAEQARYEAILQSVAQGGETLANQNAAAYSQFEDVTSGRYVAVAQDGSFVVTWVSQNQDYRHQHRRVRAALRRERQRADERDPRQPDGRQRPALAGGRHRRERQLHGRVGELWPGRLGLRHLRAAGSAPPVRRSATSSRSTRRPRATSAGPASR